MKRSRPTNPIDDWARSHATAKELVEHTWRWSEQWAADRFARTLLACDMDWEQACRRLRPNLDNDQIERMVNYAREAPLVRVALDRLYEAMGLGAGARAEFFKELWKHFWGNDKEWAMTAARILAPYFAPETTAQEPTVLKIEGLDAGLKKMLGDPGKSAEEKVEPIDKPVTKVVQ